MDPVTATDWCENGLLNLPRRQCHPTKAPSTLREGESVVMRGRLPGKFPFAFKSILFIFRDGLAG
jgi:hypothetical protein